MPPESTTTKLTITQRLVIELKRDKKRAAVLGVCVIVALIVGVRLAVNSLGGSSPSPASGSQLIGQQNSAAGSRMPQKPGDAWAEADAIDESEPKPSISEQFAFDRDIFEPDLDFYRTGEKGSVQVRDGNAKDEGAEEKDRQAATRAKILSEANSLSLQSTMTGTSPIAIINAKVLGIGDQIAGFTVKEVTGHSCTLVKEGVEATVQMDDK